MLGILYRYANYLIEAGRTISLLPLEIYFPWCTLVGIARDRVWIASTLRMWEVEPACGLMGMVWDVFALCSGLSRVFEFSWPGYKTRIDLSASRG